MGESIFINYRRGEDQAAAGRLYDQLEATFTRERIFIDVDNIAPGRDFTEELATRVEQCDVFLAVIGRRWADVVDVDGSRRLDNPNDWVRVEIESAQRLGKHIIPVLVDGAEMPRPEKLPDALLPFARRNAARLTHERFRADVQALVVAIGRLRQAERARFEAERRQTPRVAETPAVSPRSARDAASPAAAGRRLAPMAIAALAALAVIAAGAGVLVWRLPSPAAVATDSIANPTPTKIAAAPTSPPATAATEAATPVPSAKATTSPEASPSREVKVKTDEARPTPSAAPTVVASSAPTLEPTPTDSAAAAAPPALETKVGAIEARPTPSATPTVVASSSPTLESTPMVSAAPKTSAAIEPTPLASSPVATASPGAPSSREARLEADEARSTPSAAPTVVASPTLESTPAVSATPAAATTPPPNAATTASAKAPPALEAKVSAIEAQPTLSATPTVAASTAAAPAASPLATASPDAPPPRAVEIKTDEAQPIPSAAPTVAASAPLTPIAAPPTPAAVATFEPQVALAAPAAKPAGTDLAALTPLVAAELRRLGCYSGAATGWDAVDLRLGVDKFAELAKLATLPVEPDVGLLAALKSEPDHFCAPQCSPREVASDGRCVPKTCGANQVLTHDGACVARQPKPQTTAAARAPAPAAGKRCFTFNGSSYCE
jgi:hypothetical protein